jgi:hypothetical protein
MRKLTFILMSVWAFVLTPVRGQSTNVTYVAAGKQFDIQWDHIQDEPGVIYKLYSGTNAVATFTTNSWTVVTTLTNGVTLQAKAPALLKGTNSLYITAVSSVGDESDPSNIVLLTALGKPTAPKALRKP